MVEDMYCPITKKPCMGDDCQWMSDEGCIVWKIESHLSNIDKRLSNIENNLFKLLMKMKGVEITDG